MYRTAMRPLLPTRRTLTPLWRRRGLATTDTAATPKATTSSSSVTTETLKASSPSGSTSGMMEFTSQRQKYEYLKAANAEMERYETAKELYRQGKLGNQKAAKSERGSMAAAYFGFISLFFVGFMFTPLLGKKIAQDDEFRAKYVPSWYDFTVRKPEKPWTREELHEQMVAVQREIRERAIRGDFAPEKLQALRKEFSLHEVNHNPARDSLAPSQVRKEWERIHPGLEEGEKVHED